MKKQTLLIVDDTPDMSRFLALFLSNRFETTVCISAEEAMERLSSGFLPSVMLIDRDLEGGSGLEWLKQLRRSGLRIPTMLISRRQESAVRIEALGNGADEFMSKPFHPAELALRLSRIAAREPQAVTDTPPAPRLHFVKRLVRAAAIF